jgi:hypothetical protein
MALIFRQAEKKRVSIMEVNFAPELEKKLNELAAQTGRPAADLLPGVLSLCDSRPESGVIVLQSWAVIQTASSREFNDALHLFAIQPFIHSMMSSILAPVSKFSRSLKQACVAVRTHAPLTFRGRPPRRNTASSPVSGGKRLRGGLRFQRRRLLIGK